MYVGIEPEKYHKLCIIYKAVVKVFTKVKTAKIKESLGIFGRSLKDRKRNFLKVCPFDGNSKSKPFFNG